MSLELLNAINDSSPKGEVIRLKATANMNLHGYAVVDRTFDENGKHSDEFRHIYIFPKKDVKKGEYIRVHTGIGKNRRTDNEDGTVTHHFYWESKSCVWNDDGGDVATLIKYSVVNHVEVPPVKKS